MNYGDIGEARRKAEQDIEMANAAVRQATQLITGHLRSSGVWDDVLSSLKKELKNYNMHTGVWKD